MGRHRQLPASSPASVPVDLMDAVCAQMKAKCEIVEVAWDGIIPALQAKKFDVSPVNIGESLGMEAALLQAQKLARLGYYRWSKPRREVIACNEEYREILGLPPAPFASCCSGVEPLLHADDRDRVLHAHRLAEATGGAMQLEFRIVRPDGAIRHLRDYSQAEPSPGVAPETWFGMVQDITDL